MRCDEAAALLAERIDAALEAPVHGDLDRHVAACGACASLERRLAVVVDALHEMAAETDVPRDLGARIAAAVPLRPRARPSMSRRDLRRVAGWALVMIGLGWQLGGGALAARAMGEAAPVLAEARQAVTRTRRGGILGEVERVGAGISRLAQDVRSAATFRQPPGDAR